MKVRCVNSSGSNDRLVCGDVYTVTEDTGEFYMINSIAWKSSRFVIIGDDLPEADNHTDSGTPGSTPGGTPSDVGTVDKIDRSEEKCWEAMRPSLSPGHCICGIARERCDYHRS